MNNESDDRAAAETPEATETAGGIAVPADGDGVEGEGEDQGPGASASEDHEEPEDGEAGDDGEEQAHGVEFSPEQQAAFDRAMGRKQRKLREARERADRVEQELATLKAERNALNAKVGDETVLAAMQSAGVLPEYVTADEAKLVGEAESLKASRRFLKQLVRKGEDYTGRDARGNERTWTVDQLEGELDATEERLETVGGRAAVIRQRIIDEYRADCQAGRKARKAGGAGAPVKPQVRRPVGVVAPPAVPTGGGQRRADPARPAAGGVVDWSKVNSLEELEKAEEAEERAKLRSQRR